MTADPVPADVPALLRALLAGDPGRPRLTWYGPGGERVELSAKVLDNWVAKAANLLVDELDSGPGSAVLVDLPAHWRTVTWLLAIWSAGAAAVLPGTGDPPSPPPLAAGLHPDVVLSHRPRTWTGATGPFAGAAVVAVALPALAARFPGQLPPGAIDGAEQVRGQGDVFVPPVRPVPADPCLVTPDGTLTTHGELLPVAARVGRAAGWPPRARVLTGSGPASALQLWLPVLVAGGSLVLHHDLAGTGAADRDRLVAQERIQVIAASR